MVEHYTSVTVSAPVHQVYTLFTHFNDFPKFMRFVKEVTYYDDQRSHWVVQVLGQYEWDAVNEDWIPNRQVGWRSTSGLKNSGKVKFQALGPNRTMVDVYIHYSPPSGILGALGENLGVNSYFERVLREDMQNFARMVEEAPAGALDPMSSHYLFHDNSAAARKIVTPRQNESMARDPMMSRDALEERQARIAREEAWKQQELQRREEEEQQKRERELKGQQALARQARESLQRMREEEAARAASLADAEERKEPPHPVYDTLGGRNASIERTALGDRDALRPRYTWYEQDPMVSRLPPKKKDPTQPLVDETKVESPWYQSIRGSSAKEETPPPST